VSRPEKPARLLLAGIDEAGLGPLLGSLALGYTLIEVPAAAPDPWKALRATVAKSIGAKRRLVVADSKVLFQRNARGRARLETTVLAFWMLTRSLTQRTPAAEFLLGSLAPAPRWRELPWARELPTLPASIALDSLELTRAVLARALERERIELVDSGVRLVPAAELNASFAATGNKSVSLWERVTEVLRHCWSQRRRAPLRATVDMLGGRRRYGSALGRAFPEAEVRLEGETRGRSAYRLTARDGSGTMELAFRVQADRHCFEVALASCFAKYARELEMQAFNAHFAKLQPDLLPTAGYRGDGARWLAQAGPALARAGLTREALARTR
jgi:ribonuclease HII